MLENLKSEQRKNMQKVINDLERAFEGLRTGRASLGLVDHINVEAYGATMPLMQMATLGTPDARTIAISPFDAGQIGAIEKAIINSDVGITPVNDGKTIRLTIPTLTEERRKEMVKLAKKYAEDHRVAIRKWRHHFNDDVKDLEKEHEISEDEMHHELDAGQKLTDQFVKNIDEHTAKKEQEIMEV